MFFFAAAAVESNGLSRRLALSARPDAPVRHPAPRPARPATE
jgi:hypothetical protein